MMLQATIALVALVSLSVCAKMPILSHHGSPPELHALTFFLNLFPLTVEHINEDSKPTEQVPERETFQFLDEEPEVSTLRRRRTVIDPPLALYQSYPNELETNVVGPVVNPIYPNTPAFNALTYNVCA